MLVRSVAAMLIAAALAGCSGATGTSGPPSTSGPAGTGSAATSPAIDLSDLDACALVPMSTVEALTGEKGFTADASSDPSTSTCFWGVPRAGVPQYLEVRVFRRSGGLAGYTISPNGVACPTVPVPGIGTEAVGGVCSAEQTKVFLVALDRGVAVQVLVNEPKGALTPANLASAVNAVIAGLG
jgi:hypothetical protein